MRGKETAADFVYNENWITPAYAGKSRALYAEAKNYEDHPRLCGEKVEQRNIVIDTIGSPPPMRGKAFRRTG